MTDRGRDTPPQPPPPPPSPWIAEHADLVAVGGHALDVASGDGRNAWYLLQRGHPVTAVDIDLSRLPVHPLLTPVHADLEAEAWPFPGARFDAVVVTRYLHRPLLSVLVDAVAPGGVLIYETFMVGQERLGRPTNPDFLLQPGELLAALGPHLTVIDVQEGSVGGAVMQRIACVRD